MPESVKKHWIKYALIPIFIALIPVLYNEVNRSRNDEFTIINPIIDLNENQDIRITTSDCSRVVKIRIDDIEIEFTPIQSPEDNKWCISLPFDKYFNVTKPIEDNTKYSFDIRFLEQEQTKYRKLTFKIINYLAYSNQPDSNTDSSPSSRTDIVETGNEVKPSNVSPTQSIDDEKELRYLVIGGSYRQRVNAEERVNTLKDIGFTNTKLEKFNRGTFYIALVGQFDRYTTASELAEKVQAKGIECKVMRRR